jgi:ABC-type thiamine transport system ATPase subunit
LLHKYSFSNFQSFLDRVEVDLTLNKKTHLTDWMCEAATGERLSKLLAVIGPNGSGKTALLKPVAFLGWFVSQSFQQLAHDHAIPVTPHFAAADRPCEFEIEFDFDGRLCRYALHCTNQRVIHEALYQKRERFSYVFIRDWNEAAGSYVIKQQDFGFAPKEAGKVRQNASLIATAAQYGVPLAVRMAVPDIITNVNVLGRMPMGEGALFAAADHFSRNPKQQAHVESLLANWDLGLSGVNLEQIPTPTLEDPDKKIWMPFGRHTTKKAEVSIPFLVESSGTQSAFVLLSRLLPTLAIGGLAVIDEFENDLHPHMLAPILELFANSSTNPHNAQLLFTCHAVEVLNLIHKSQVMLVQKNEDCESTAYRLDSVEGIRNDDNFYAKYMAGAYGAVPEL